MNPEHRFLALDIATQTGYAVMQNGKFVKSGVRDFTLRMGKHKGHQGIMFYNFLRELGRIDHVFFEQIMFAGSFKNEDGEIVHTTNDGRETYLGLKMVMNMFCAGFQLEPIGIWPGTLKKQFAGSGRAEKADMCRAARAIGWRGDNHNEADAIGIMVVKIRELYGVTPTF
jgi:hypothetical protein